MSRPPNDAEQGKSRPRGEMSHVPPSYGPELPFERIAINGGALCIECKACGRRSALTSDDCEHIRRGNKTLVNTMKFRCGRHGCGSTDVRLYNAHTMEEADMFMVGDRMPEGREIEEPPPPTNV